MLETEYSGIFGQCHAVLGVYDGEDVGLFHCESGLLLSSEQKSSYGIKCEHGFYNL